MESCSFKVQQFCKCAPNCIFLEKYGMTNRVSGKEEEIKMVSRLHTAIFFRLTDWSITKLFSCHYYAANIHLNSHATSKYWYISFPDKTHYCSYVKLFRQLHQVQNCTEYKMVPSTKSHQQKTLKMCEYVNIIKTPQDTNYRTTH